MVTGFRSRLFMLCLLLAPFGSIVRAQNQGKEIYGELRWRLIGPHRGGRTVGATGIPDQPNVFYIGVNNGGVWRTDDYGRTWDPLFDDQPTGSVGAVAVAPSDPSVIYVGSGEGLQRPDLSVGDGIFKSTDGGKTWRHKGLDDAQQIGAVIVDPRDPGRLFVAVLGHPYGPNQERGIFRSKDGGDHWEKVLYKDENTGAIALAFDPSNPEIIYADLWSSRQGPWENGEWEGKTSGLFKSVDGGTTWHQLTNGLPSAAQGLGRIGFAIAPSDPKRLYAVVDAGQLGGVYRSDDGGQNWIRVNSEDRIWGRGSDFAEVKVHPRDKDVLYVANTSVYRSQNGGTDFTAIKGAPGGDDYHTIWINPVHPDIMLFASDQGAVVTVNGGRTWSSWYNQPTGQFYHVITDNEFPYNVYGGQQESGSAGIASRGNDGRITFREWHPVAADEWAYIAPDPLHPDTIYGGKVTRFLRSTGRVQNVAPEAIRSGKYRVLRTAPLVFSPVDRHTLYFATNVLFKTTTGGLTWDIISPDLSREAPDVPASIGIFRTEAMAKQPRRGTIYALAPSPTNAQVLWAGTDDGTVHFTSDGGAHWNDVTPRGMTSWSKIAGIDAGHYDAKTAYVAVNRIRLDDMRPHIYRTRDNGRSWEEIVRGLPASGPVNVVREDPVRKGLLFAGSERAVYVSFDDGTSWKSLRMNMPASSVRDLVIHGDDVVAATHGRSFWILDGISPLRQMGTDGLPPAGLLRPGDACRVRWNMNTDTPLPPDEPAGENPPDGALIDYYLPRAAGPVSLEIFDPADSLVRTYSSTDRPDSVIEKELRIPTYWLRPPATLSAREGMHRFVWDLHAAPPEGFKPWYPISATPHASAPQPTGPWALPGRYRVVLHAGGKSYSQPLEVRMDPRVGISPGNLREQYDVSMECYRGLKRLHELGSGLHTLRTKVRQLKVRINDPALSDSLARFDARLGAFNGTGDSDDLDIVYSSVAAVKRGEETISGLSTTILYLMLIVQGADAAPTPAQVLAVRDQRGALDSLEHRWDDIVRTDLQRLNGKLLNLKIEPLKPE